MMKKTTVDLIQLADLGTNLIVDASTRSTVDLIQLVGVVGLNGGHLRLVNCNKKTNADLISILNIYPKNVTLDFTIKELNS